MPLIAPSAIGVDMFGFTLSWDEIARTSQAIYALGAATSVVSFAVMRLAILGTWALKRRQGDRR